MGPYAWGHTWFQYAVIAEPASTVAVSCRALDVPSSLQDSVGSVGSVIGLLITLINFRPRKSITRKTN